MFKYIAAIFDASRSGRCADFGLMMNQPGLQNLFLAAAYCDPLDKIVMRKNENGNSLLLICSGRSHWQYLVQSPMEWL